MAVYKTKFCVVYLPTGKSLAKDEVTLAPNTLVDDLPADVAQRCLDFGAIVPASEAEAALFATPKAAVARKPGSRQKSDPAPKDTEGKSLDEAFD